MNVFFGLGKTTLAMELAKTYNAQVIGVDNVIMDAILHSGTFSSVVARNLCIEAKYGPAEHLQSQHEEVEHHALQDSKPKLRKYFIKKETGSC